MSTESTEDQKLLQAVFKQIDLANISLNFEVLAKDLDLAGKNPRGAASKRWSRYKQKNGLVGGRSAKNESGDEKETDMKSELKSGNGKKKGNGLETANGEKRAAKKRKLSKDEDNESE